MLNKLRTLIERDRHRTKLQIVCVFPGTEQFPQLCGHATLADSHAAAFSSRVYFRRGDLPEFRPPPLNTVGMSLCNMFDFKMYDVHEVCRPWPGRCQGTCGGVDACASMHAGSLCACLRASLRVRAHCVNVRACVRACVRAACVRRAGGQVETPLKAKSRNKEW